VAAQKPVEKLLSSQMTRREFLGFLGAAALAVIGVGAILDGLHGLVNNKEANAGYGGGAYGGRALGTRSVDQS
jgi:hypothetical protein